MQLHHVRRGSGEPLVLLHGIGSQWQVWTPVLGRLATEREVIAIDLPGFGATPPLREAVVGPERFAQAVAGFFDQLGLRDPHVAGHSMGGGISLELGRMGRARSVTSLAPVGFWNEREHAYSRALLRATVAGTRAAGPALPWLVGNPVIRTLTSCHLSRRPWRIPPHAAVEGARNLARSRGFAPALAGFAGWRFRDGQELRCAVTVAWGQFDLILIPRQANRARRALPSARHLTLRGCGHVPTWDDPEQVARVLLEGCSG